MKTPIKKHQERLQDPGVFAQYTAANAHARPFGGGIWGLVEEVFWDTLDSPNRPIWCSVARPILKVLRRDEWQSLLLLGETNGAPIDSADGYIHFSTPEQVDETVARHFAGEEVLWLLTMDAERYGSELVFEPSRGGQLFPHLYAPLRLSDVCLVRPWV